MELPGEATRDQEQRLTAQWKGKRCWVKPWKFQRDGFYGTIGEIWLGKHCDGDILVQVFDDSGDWRALIPEEFIID